MSASCSLPWILSLIKSTLARSSYVFVMRGRKRTAPPISVGDRCSIKKCRSIKKSTRGGFRSAGHQSIHGNWR